MRQFFRTFAVAALLPVATEGQIRDSRTSDYLFLTAASDVRATWVNPAGLVTVPEASIMGEIVLGKLPGQDLHFDQYTVGLNSRGFSLAYQRDRFRDGPSSNIVRISTALPFPSGAIGVAASWYGIEGPNRRDVDIGLMYRPNSIMALGATLRHIGRPELDETKLPLIVDGGAGIAILGGRLFAAGEATAVERFATSGWDLTYRAGAYGLIPLRRPISLIAVVDFDSDFAPTMLNVGLAVGGRNSVTAVATILDGIDGPEFERISAAGVVSNALTGR